MQRWFGKTKRRKRDFLTAIKKNKLDPKSTKKYIKHVYYLNFCLQVIVDAVNLEEGTVKKIPSEATTSWI